MILSFLKAHLIWYEFSPTKLYDHMIYHPYNFNLQILSEISNTLL
jgi:hypothetical protein